MVAALCCGDAGDAAARSRESGATEAQSSPRAPDSRPVARPPAGTPAALDLAGAPRRAGRDFRAFTCRATLGDNLALQGRSPDARRLFEHLLSLRNESACCPRNTILKAKRLVGNFRQAFSHVGLINTAMNLSPADPSPAHQRGE
jgi:hypothetical protein